MRRYTGQKPLYEAIAKTKGKSRRRTLFDLLHPGSDKPEQEGPSAAQPAVEEPKPQVESPKTKSTKSRLDVMKPAVEKAPAKAPVDETARAPAKPIQMASSPERLARPAQGWLRPKSFQLHDGRIDISVPYPLGVTVALVAILLVLGAFRLGQRLGVPEVAAPPNPAGEARPAPSASVPTRGAPAPRAEPPAETTSAGSEIAAPAAAVQGDHVIVLGQHPRREDLEAAGEYFAQQGIATRIIAVDMLREYLTSQGLNANVVGDRGGFMLVTSDYYDNPQSPGTDGYAAKQKIVELGRGYKAQSGMDSFAPNYFSDAYGMKVR